MPLNDLKIRQAKPSEKIQKLTDSNGLILEIKPSGSKLWRYRYRIDAKENMFAIGEYPDVSLQEARRLRDAARELVKQGIHPAHHRKTERSTQILSNRNTFEAIAIEYAKKKADTWSKNYALQFENAMKNNVYPTIGKMPIKSITAKMVLGILQEMEKRKAIALAILVRQYISQVFCYGVITGRADGDPAAALKGYLQRPAVQHSRQMSLDEIRKLKDNIANYGGMFVTKAAMQILLYTFVRTIELRLAPWDEFDLKNAVWRIPAERMKMRRPHIVPLSNQVVKILKELHQVTGGSKWLLPNTRRHYDVMSPTTINRMFEYMGYGVAQFTAHDFRATASTHLHERGYKTDWIELQLAHVEKNSVKASYNHALYLDDRTRMMQEWADWVDSI